MVSLENRTGEPLVRRVRNSGIGCCGVKVEEIGIDGGGGGGGSVGRVVRMGVLVTEKCVVKPIRCRLRRVVVVVVGFGVRENGTQRGIGKWLILRRLLVGEVEGKVVGEGIVIRHGRAERKGKGISD